MKPMGVLFVLGATMLGIAQNSSTVSLVLRQQSAEGDWEDRGKVTLTQKLITEGGKSVEVRIESISTVTRQQTIYDLAGNSIRRYSQTLLDGKPVETRITTFNNNGALIVTDRGGERKSVFVPFLKGVPTVNPSEFWFLRDIPKPGASVSWQCLNDQNDFVPVKTSYRGRVPVPAKNVEGSLVVSEFPNRKVESYFDAKGDLILMRDNLGVRMERA
jgi:hypothetical protein